MERNISIVSKKCTRRFLFDKEILIVEDVNGLREEKFTQKQFYNLLSCLFDEKYSDHLRTLIEEETGFHEKIGGYEISSKM